MARSVLTTDRSGVRTLTLNRPARLNALNRELLADLCTALDDALTDEKVGNTDMIWSSVGYWLNARGTSCGASYANH